MRIKTEKEGTGDNLGKTEGRKKTRKGIRVTTIKRHIVSLLFRQCKK